MFRRPHRDDRAGEELLGRAMRALPDPEITPGFNNKIHQTLEQKPAKGLALWLTIRPGAYAAGGTFAVTLALLSLLGGSGHFSSLTDAPTLSAAAALRTDRLSDVETFIEGAGLTSASLRTVIAPQSASGPGASPGLPASRPLRTAPSTHPVQGA